MPLLVSFRVFRTENRYFCPQRYWLGLCVKKYPYKTLEQVLYGYFRQIEWRRSLLMKRRSYGDESDDRNAIPIKFDNVIFAMTAKKCAKNCAQVQRVCFAY